MIEGDHVAIYSLLALAIICAVIVFWAVGAF